MPGADTAELDTCPRAGTDTIAEAGTSSRYNPSNSRLEPGYAATLTIDHSSMPVRPRRGGRIALMEARPGTPLGDAPSISSSRRATYQSKAMFAPLITGSHFSSSRLTKDAASAGVPPPASTACLAINSLPLALAR
jgi:hypothetical protein